MTIQEIIESIDYCLKCDNDRIPTTQEDLQTIKEALKKQIPKKPIKKDIGKLKIPDTAFCPICDNPVIKDETDNYEQAYCDYCGQALGWSVKE